MNDFTASNGIDVHYRTNERGVSVASHPNGHDVTPGQDMDVEQTDALRDFFRHELDEELGRWRSTSDPTWTAVLDTETGWVQFRNDDGLREFSIVPDSPGTFSPWNTELRSIGAEYVEAHPQRKPWHDAKQNGDGAEVWALSIEGVEGERAYIVDGNRFECGPHSIHRTDPSIVAGRKIWPEDAS